MQFWMEMRKQCEGFQLSTCGDSQIYRSHSRRDGAKQTGHTSGSNTREEDRSSSGDDVATMDVDAR
jgi:hypothetical protein